jgi:hypothetical protein
MSCCAKIHERNSSHIFLDSITVFFFVFGYLFILEGTHKYSKIVKML